MTTEKEFKKRIGEDAVDILEKKGINVGKVFADMMEKKKKQKAALEDAVLNAGMDALMTSELVYMSIKMGRKLKQDVYLMEWTRRMEQIGMTDLQITTLLGREKEAISEDVPNREKSWVKRTPFGEGITKKDVPPFEHLTLSEINLFTDYARYLKAVAHESLSGDAWQAVAEHAYHQPYAHQLKKWGKENGISEELIGKFWYNEGSLLSEFKYGYGKNQSLWREKKDD